MQANPSAPPVSGESAWRMALQFARPERALLLLALMIAAGLREGLGLLMIVPILQSLVPGEALPGALAQIIGKQSPATLGILLAVFVLLVALRAGVGLWLRIEATRLNAHIVDGLR